MEPTLNCPSCGRAILAQQQYCRACGAAISPSRGVHPALFGTSFALAGLLVALTAKMTGSSNTAVYVGVIMTVIGMFLIAMLPMIFGPGRRKQPPIITSGSELTAASTTNKLGPMPAAAHFASVTENTTNLLNEDVIRPQKKNEPQI